MRTDPTAQAHRVSRRHLMQAAGLVAGSLHAPWLLAASAAGAASWQLGQRIELPPLPLLGGSVQTFAKPTQDVVIVEFWHTQCPFCARQNPVLNAFYKQHRSKGLQVYAVHIDNKDPQAVQRYVDAHGYVFTVGLANAPWQALFKQRKGLPQLFLMDRKGILKRIELGEMFADDLEEFSQLL